MVASSKVLPDFVIFTSELIEYLLRFDLASFWEPDSLPDPTGVEISALRKRSGLAVIPGESSLLAFDFPELAAFFPVEVASIEYEDDVDLVSYEEWTEKEEQTSQEKLNKGKTPWTIT